MLNPSSSSTINPINIQQQRRCLRIQRDLHCGLCSSYHYPMELVNQLKNAVFMCKRKPLSGTGLSLNVQPVKLLFRQSSCICTIGYQTRLLFLYQNNTLFERRPSHKTQVTFLRTFHICNRKNAGNSFKSHWSDRRWLRIILIWWSSHSLFPNYTPNIFQIFI